jgi:hypothetical protein
MATKKTDIRAELLAATDVKPKKGESNEDLSNRVAMFISDKLDEGDYEKLSKPAKGWFEAYCEAAKEGQDLPQLPMINGADVETAVTPKKKLATVAKEDDEGTEGDEGEGTEGDEGEGTEDETPAEEAPPPKKAKVKAATRKVAVQPKKVAAKPVVKPVVKPVITKPVIAAKKKPVAQADDEPKKRRGGPKGPRDGAALATMFGIMVKNPKLSSEQVLSKLTEQGHEVSIGYVDLMHRYAHLAISKMREQGWSRQ